MIKRTSFMVIRVGQNWIDDIVKHGKFAWLND